MDRDAHADVVVQVKEPALLIGGVHNVDSQGKANFEEISGDLVDKRDAHRGGETIDDPVNHVLTCDTYQWLGIKVQDN